MATSVNANVFSTRKHNIEVDISRMLVGVPAGNEDTVVVTLITGGDRAPRTITLTYAEVDNLLKVATNGY